MPTVSKRQFYQALARVVELPEAERRAVLAKLREIVREAQGEALLQEALGEGWQFDQDAGGQESGASG